MYLVWYIIDVSIIYIDISPTLTLILLPHYWAIFLCAVGIIPGGIAETFAVSQGMKDGYVGDKECMVVRNRKGFVATALETGASIVPWLVMTFNSILFLFYFHAVPFGIHAVPRDFWD